MTMLRSPARSPWTIGKDSNRSTTRWNDHFKALRRLTHTETEVQTTTT